MRCEVGEHSISRSVGRLFEVLEVFRETRRPWSISELQERLDYPYSSIRVIIKSLTDLEYLSYRADDRRYFPTLKVALLGSWLQPSLLELSGLNALLGIVARELNESVGIASRATIFMKWVQVRNSSQPFSLRLPVGVGAIMTSSVTGRVLLSQLDEQELKRVIDYTKYWIRTNGSEGPMPDVSEIERSVDLVHRHGYLVDYNVWIKDIGTIAFPVRPSPTGVPLSISVSGHIDRIKAHESQITERLRDHLAMYAENSAMFAHSAVGTRREPEVLAAIS